MTTDVVVLNDEQRALIRDFVAALRSGEYTQTQHKLGSVQESGRMYCCEGVACERYGERAGLVVEWAGRWGKQLQVTDPTVPENAFHAQRVWRAIAPRKLWDYLGMSPNIPMVEGSVIFTLPSGYLTWDTRESEVSLVSLNDGGFTFEQIADVIEWYWLPEDRSV